MGSRWLIRTGLLVLGVLCWATVAPAQLPPVAGATSGGSGDADRSDAAAPSPAWFEIVRLNPGLSPAPPDLYRQTPKGTVENFLAAIDAQDYDRAAHFLDLSRIPVDSQAERGPRLAAKLGRLIQTNIWLDWDGLPDRPDALVEGGIGATPRAGEMRRSLILGRLDLDGHTAPIRLRRVKPAGADPVWVVAPQSVGRIDALYAQHAPGWIVSRLPPDWQKMSWFSLRRWELVALPALLVAAVMWFVALRVALGWLAGMMPWQPANRALLGARTALALLAAAIPLHLIINRLIAFSAPVNVVTAPMLIGVMILAVAIAVLRGLDHMIEHFARRLVGDPESEYGQHQRQIYTTIYAVCRILLLVVFVLGFGFVLTQLDIFSAVGVSLLASAGVLTVILGIAAQPILGNILSSLQIALSKPIRIGDAIEYEGRWAYVEGIFYTFVRLRTWDHRRLIVPVQYFLSHPFENYSVVERKMTWTFSLTVDPSADIQEIREAYVEIAGADDDSIDQEILKVLAVGHDYNGVVLNFYCTAQDAGTAWSLHCRLREKLLDWIRLHHPEWWPRQRELQEHPSDISTAEPPSEEIAERSGDNPAGESRSDESHEDLGKPSSDGSPG